MNETDPITPTLGVVLGAVLILVGVAGYALSDFASVTALIPAIFGLVMIGLGLVGRRDDQRVRLAVYGIGGLALLGVLGSLRGVPDIVALVTGSTGGSTLAAVTQGAMILVGLVLLGAAVRDLATGR